MIHCGYCVLVYENRISTEKLQSAGTLVSNSTLILKNSGPLSNQKKQLPNFYTIKHTTDMRSLHIADKKVLQMENNVITESNLNKTPKQAPSENILEIAMTDAKPK